MKRYSSLLVATSGLLCALLAAGADRPHYGGTLRVEIRESPQILDPANLNTTAAESLSRLVFETLVALDDQGRPQPLLATSWQAEPGNQRWRFQLRSGVSFSDGTSLDGAAVAASLRNSNPEWKVIATADTVLIETEKPDAEMPAELALARNGIVHHSGNGLIGTGPFTTAQWIAGQRATLKANEQYWGGRAFLDSIEVECGKNDHEQLMTFDLGKADVVEVAAETIRRAQAENRNVMTSAPSELIGLVFTADPRSEDEAHARNLLAASINKAALNDVVLQGGGEPTASLLPNWISGYGFLFANQVAGTSTPVPHKVTQKWTLNFDSSDPIARLIAQRVALNARDAGITVEISPSQSADIRLLRVPLESDDAHVALQELSKALPLAVPSFKSESITDIFAAEKTLLQSNRTIPLLHVRSGVALRTPVHEFRLSPDGIWRLENVWLSPEKP